MKRSPAKQSHLSQIHLTNAKPVSEEKRTKKKQKSPCEKQLNNYGSSVQNQSEKVLTLSEPFCLNAAVIMAASRF